MQKKSLSRYWLIIGVTALAIAGLYSLVLAGGRSPKIGEASFLHRLFFDALVVHVDLSVLVWFLCIACLMWSLATRGARQIVPYLEEAALLCFALGTAFITLSPLDDGGSALMSNYIPVIHSPVFFLGLMLVFCGTALMLLKVFTAPLKEEFAFALFAAALITFIAFAAFIWSFTQMPNIIDGQQYYDMLFWGGGHVLQFTHVQIMMVAWIMLTRALQPSFHIRRTVLYSIFSIGLISAFATSLPYLLFEVTSMQHREFFTQQMMVAGGAAPVIMLVFLWPAIWRGRGKNALWSAMLMSAMLFLYGGLLGGMIHGQNVVIPAHYHGSIVGVTLAFMGAAYLLLPVLGYKDVTRTKLAFWQPIIYGVGQIMHVSGFAWSGGYGALRKTPGGSYDGAAQTAMGLMGGGAGLAAIGGLLFVVVVARATMGSSKESYS